MKKLDLYIMSMENLLLKTFLTFILICHIQENGVVCTTANFNVGIDIEKVSEIEAFKLAKEFFQRKNFMIYLI